MVLLSIITAYIFFTLIPINDETSELLSRTSPDFRDVLIAFFGGLALIIAKTKKENISSAIFGVAIATALMPPLCTVGYYLAENNLTNAAGAFLLFLINTLYIIVATYIVLKVLGFPLKVYANSKRRKFVNRAVTLIAASFAAVAVLEFFEVVDESKFEREAKSFLKSELAELPNGDYLINSAITDYNGGESQITINTFGQKPISKEIMDLLEKKIKNNDELKSTKIVFIQQELEDLHQHVVVLDVRRRLQASRDELPEGDAVPLKEALLVRHEELEQLGELILLRGGHGRLQIL